MKKKYIVWAVIIIVVAGIVYLRFESKNRLKYTSVKTTKAAVGQIKSYLSTTATIKSKNSKDYYGLSGKVTAVNVKVGSAVKSGDLLVKYDTPDLASTVKQAQINYDNAVLAKQSEVNANNDMNNKMADLDRQISDLDSKIAAAQASKNPQEISNAAALQTQKSTLKSSRDALKQPFTNEQLKQEDNAIALAKLSLDTANTNLAKNTDSITAEFNGVITALTASLGATGNPAVAAVTVQDLSSL